MNAKRQLPPGWAEMKFGEIAMFKNGANFSASDRGVELKILGVGDFQDRIGLKDTSELKSVHLASQPSEDNFLETEDLVFVRSNGSKELVGRCLHIECDPRHLIYSGFCIRARLHSDITTARYVNLLMQNGVLKNQLVKDGRGTNISNLNQGILDNLNLALPPLSEQKAIADLLSPWSEAIEKTERLIQAKERQKLGELHFRISNQKANSKIGSFAKPVVRKVDKPEESYVAVGIRSHFKGTFQRLVEDPRTVNMDSLYRVKENDLILNITFAWEGAIALVKKEDEECYVSHRFPTFEIKRSKAEPCFIRQLIMSSRMKYDLSNISPGGAGRNRVLNKKDFLKMPIWLPDLETQKNIGEYLGAIDKEIDLLKQLAEKYKTQKRGLMQKMLTGEWRVKPEIVNQYS